MADPCFVRKDDIRKAAWRVMYADDNPNQVISEQRISYDSSGSKSEGPYGAGAAEFVVSRVLS
jgi:hypothetical protein